MVCQYPYPCVLCAPFILNFCFVVGVGPNFPVNFRRGIFPRRSSHVEGYPVHLSEISRVGRYFEASLVNISCWALFRSFSGEYVDILILGEVMI